MSFFVRVFFQIQPADIRKPIDELEDYQPSPVDTVQGHSGFASAYFKQYDSSGFVGEFKPNSPELLPVAFSAAPWSGTLCYGPKVEGKLCYGPTMGTAYRMAGIASFPYFPHGWHGEEC